MLTISFQKQHLKLMARLFMFLFSFSASFAGSEISCKKDSDCVKIEARCGTAKAVNKVHKEAEEEKERKAGELASCASDEESYKSMQPFCFRRNCVLKVPGHPFYYDEWSRCNLPADCIKMSNNCAGDVFVNKKYTNEIKQYFSKLSELNAHCTNWKKAKWPHSAASCFSGFCYKNN